MGNIEIDRVYNEVENGTIMKTQKAARYEQVLKTNVCTIPLEQKYGLR